MNVSETSPENVIITPIRYLRIIVVLLGFVFLPLAWVFILWGTTLSIFFGAIINLTILWTVSKVLLSKIGYNGTILVVKGILRRNELDMSKIVKISKIRLFGTVGQVPVSISSVLFTFEDGTQQRLGFRIFPYEAMIALLDDISSHIDQ